MRRIFVNTLKVLNSSERKKLAIFTGLNLLVSIIDIGSLVLLVAVITFYTQGDLHFDFARRFHWLFDRNSMLPITVFFILFILKSIMGYLVVAAQYRYVYDVASRISRFNLLKYLEGDYDDYVHIDSSIHVRKILHQPIEFCHYVLAGFQQIITEMLLSFFALAAILVFNAKLFFLLAAVMLPPIMMITYFAKRKLKNARAHARTSSERSLQHLHEALSGYIESNIYDKNNFFTDRFSHFQQRMAKYHADIQATQAAPPRLIEVFVVFGLFFLVVVNKFMGNSGMVEIINIGAFMAAAYKIIPGIVKISNAGGQIKTYEYTVNDLLDNKYAERQSNRMPSEKIESLDFNSVGFVRGENIILRGFDLKISKGDFIGISGPSGRGKTTFVNLLLGFISPDSGDILINGNRTTATERRHFWQHIAYVQQRPFLVHDTISANITLGETAHADGYLNEIIRIVGLDDFIDQFPEGLSKIITENGKNISGGQRQRVAIARALYKNADVMILDEPFSELDGKSEEHILRYLAKLSQQGKTIILITHKNDNLKFCDKTYTIDTVNT